MGNNGMKSFIKTVLGGALVAVGLVQEKNTILMR